jgi:C1A family cysteine protease
MTTNISYKLTYSFQPEDTRDYICKTVPHPRNNKVKLHETIKKGIKTLKAVKAPPAVFKISSLPAIPDQGTLGTCVANSFSFTISKQTNENLKISRLMLYALSRCIDDTPLSQDDGTTIRSTCQAIKQYGACKETVFPYITNKAFSLPPLETFNNSKRFKSFTYLFIKQDLLSIKSALQTYNSPIVFGFMVYQSFMNARNGLIPMPDVNKEKLLGGHCITIVGYNDTTQMFTCSNNWSTKWGINGYCLMPYAFILNANLASDFCVTTYVY